MSKVGRSVVECLFTLSRKVKTTVCELMQEAVREGYIVSRKQQRKAMQEFVGSRKERSRSLDTVDYIRSLRRDSRLDRMT